MKPRNRQQSNQGSPRLQQFVQMQATDSKQVKEPYELEVKDLILPLGALWAWGGLVLPLVLELNKIRDRVLGMDPNVQLKPEYRTLLLENDWVYLGGFLVFLCIVFGLICILLPTMLPKERRSGKLKLMSQCVGGIAMVTGGLWFVTCFRDAREMRAAIAACSTNAAPKNGAITNTVSTIIVGSMINGTNNVATSNLSKGAHVP